MAKMNNQPSDYKQKTSANQTGAKNADDPDLKSSPESAAILGDALEKLRKYFHEQASEALGEIINAYLHEAPMLIGRMRQAIEESIPQQLQNAAHTLKSSSATLGAAGLAQLCQEMETIAQADNVPEVSKLFSQLSAEYVRVETALQDELTKL